MHYTGNRKGLKLIPGTKNGWLRGRVEAFNIGSPTVAQMRI